MNLYPNLDPTFVMPADDDPRFELASELLNTFKELRTQYLSPMRSFGFSGAGVGSIDTKENIASSMRIVAQGLQQATGFDMGLGEPGIQLVRAVLTSPYAGGHHRRDRWGAR